MSKESLIESVTKWSEYALSKESTAEVEDYLTGLPGHKLVNQALRAILYTYICTGKPVPVSLQRINQFKAAYGYPEPINRHDQRVLQGFLTHFGTIEMLKKTQAARFTPTDPELIQIGETFRSLLSKDKNKFVIVNLSKLISKNND